MNISCGQNHAVQLGAISHHAHWLVQTGLGYCACTLLVTSQHQNAEIYPWRRYHRQFPTKPSLAWETVKSRHQTDAMSSRQSWIQEPGCDIWTQSVFAEHMVLHQECFSCWMSGVHCMESWTASVRNGLGINQKIFQHSRKWVMSQLLLQKVGKCIQSKILINFGS